MLSKIILMALSAILIENFVLSKFLGICAFLGVSKKTDTAVGMGLAVTFVMTLSSVFTWIVNRFVLVPLDLEYLQTIAFILIIACLVQFIEMFMKKYLPALYNALGIYLPLITTNCAVLGVALLNIESGYSFVEAVIYGFTAGIGYLMAIVIFSGIRSRLEFSNIPKPFQGFPIALIAAALMSMAFMGFNGLSLPL